MGLIVSELCPNNFFNDFDDDDDNDVLEIHVRRGALLVSDALREGVKKKFGPGKKLKVRC